MHEASYPALTQAINQQLAPFRKAQDGTMSGFTAMAKAAMAHAKPVTGACMTPSKRASSSSRLGIEARA